MQYVLGLDQGTSGTKAYLMDAAGVRVGLGYQAVRRTRTRPGWAELDPLAVADSAQVAMEKALVSAGVSPRAVLAVGIASQRDTDFAWDAVTGAPLATAITWQDLRTIPQVEALPAFSHFDELRYRLGYYPGPWCSAMHMSWRMKNQPAWREAAQAGRLRVGMAAGWLIQALGEPAGHLHDYSLTQKTGLWDIRRGCYWGEWLEYLGLAAPGFRAALPTPVPTLADYGLIRVAAAGVSAAVPVAAMIGDQQAALFGYDCRVPGDAECTHGTASFINVVAAGQPAGPGSGAGDAGAALLPPEVASLNVYYSWTLPGGQDKNGFRHAYCLEADTTSSGAAVRWMVDKAHLLDDETKIDALASSVPDAGGVVFIPAFTGLNVPYHDHRTRATLLGLTLNHDRAHIARAFLDALAFQIRAIVDTIQGNDRSRAGTGLAIQKLSVGGGLSRSDLACQLQADWIGIPLYRPLESETTARGAALLAGLAVDFWPSLDALPELPPGGRTFTPRLSAAERDAGFERWERAVQLARSWRE